MHLKELTDARKDLRAQRKQGVLTRKRFSPSVWPLLLGGKCLASLGHARLGPASRIHVSKAEDGSESVTHAFSAHQHCTSRFGSDSKTSSKLNVVSFVRLQSGETTISSSETWLECAEAGSECCFGMCGSNCAVTFGIASCVAWASCLTACFDVFIGFVTLGHRLVKSILAPRIG